MTTYDDLPPFLLGFPGPLRDRLTAAVLSGAKTATTGLVAEYEAEGEPFPEPGRRSVLLDSAERPRAVVEVTGVSVLRLADVDLAYAIAEGEGYRSVAEWRRTHEEFWRGAPVREAIGDPGFTVDDDTLVLAERFRVVALLDGADGAGSEENGGAGGERDHRQAGEARKADRAGEGEGGGGRG